MINYEKLKEDAINDGIEKFVVGGIVTNKNKILLLERPKDDFMGGIYELPSGNLENKETLEQGLIREVNEETGLHIKSIVGYLGYFDYSSGSGKKARQFNFVVEVIEYSNIILTEHSSFVWADINKAHEYPITDSIKEIISTYLNNT